MENNREIKFRGWHTTAKRMFSAEEMAKDQLTLLPTGQFINVHGNLTSLSTIYHKDKFIPLQFTGLFDKNGKEIYEGDRLSYYFLKVNTSTILEDGGQITVESIFQYDVMDAIKRADYIEVIGNIYENPDLLTTDKTKD